MKQNVNYIWKFRLKGFLAQWISYFLIIYLVADEVNPPPVYWLRLIFITALTSSLSVWLCTFSKKPNKQASERNQSEIEKIPWHKYLIYFLGSWILLVAVFLMLNQDSFSVLSDHTFSYGLLLRIVLGSGLLALSTNYQRYLTSQGC